MPTDKTQTTELNNGILMPIIGYGTYLMPPRQTEALVRQALDVGYRHIDTAQNYGNEREVGLAVKHSGIAREEIFITSKTQTTGYHATKKGIIQSLNSCNSPAYKSRYPRHNERTVVWCDDGHTKRG